MVQEKVGIGDLCPVCDRVPFKKGVRGAAMGDHRIAVLPGDGVGREVAPEAVRILDTVMEHTAHGFVYDDIPVVVRFEKPTWSGKRALGLRQERSRRHFPRRHRLARRAPARTATSPEASSSACGLDSTLRCRPIRLYEGVKHKVRHPSGQDTTWSTWSCFAAGGLYHSLLRRCAAGRRGVTPTTRDDLPRPRG